MANNSNLTPEQINMMLQIVSKKLNTDPAALKSMIEQGDINGITGNLNGSMGKKLGDVLNNPKQMQQIIKSKDLSNIINNLGK